MVAGRRGLGVALVMPVVMAVAVVTAAEPSPRDVRRQIDAVDTLLTGKNPGRAAASLAEAIAGLEAMQALPQPPAGLKFLSERAERARAELQKAGVDVSRLVVPTPAASPAVAPARPQAARPASATGISFARRVAPFLVSNCGRCHVAGRKGGFQMSSYEQLLRSAKVSPGMGKTSELVEVILSGEMPPGGGRVAADDVSMLIAWIDAGAKCDADPTADLATVARAAVPQPAAGPVAASRPLPLKPGDVSLAADVAPVILAQCVNCHGDRDPESNLRLTNLEAMLKGGRAGSAVVPGKSADSLLVKKLRGAGIEGQRMPLGKDPLPEAQIAMIARWIDQGARIDLLSPQDSLETLAAAGRSKRLSDDQLSKIRFTAGEKLWARVIPDEPPVVKTGAGFALVGNLPSERMEELATEAGEVALLVARELGVPDGPLVKGGVVVFAFRKAYDYSELWQVVAGSERPKGIDGHAGLSGDVAFGAFVVPASGTAAADTRLLLAEQVAASALAARGLPEWFCRGAGRAVAVRVAARAPAAQGWKKEAGPAAKQIGSAVDFLDGRGDPAARALVAGGFVTAIAGGGKLAQLVSLVDGGTPFEEAFEKAFRGQPHQVFTTWAGRNAGR